jgi:hypothetical protein
MPTRREFFKRVALLSGGAGVASALLPSIEKAAAIDPPDGSTYLDAEHVVILMQETDPSIIARSSRFQRSQSGYAAGRQPGVASD